jgi:outer membrane protein OmpA-like peptidoglycan-associated protein
MARKLTLTAMVAAAVFVLGGDPPPSHAQTTRLLSHDASRCDIFRGLSRKLPTECQVSERAPRSMTLRQFGRTRGLVLYGGQAASAQRPTAEDHGPEQRPAAGSTPKELSIAFRVEFEWDSFRLSPSARQVVDRVAEVLKHDLMSEQMIHVVGHADSSGPAPYNLSLSKKRSRAVQQYLIERHKIDPTRLYDVGKGESEPLDHENPSSRINRRVEFKNIIG